MRWSDHHRLWLQDRRRGGPRDGACSSCSAFFALLLLASLVLINWLAWRLLREVSDALL